MRPATVPRARGTYIDTAHPLEVIMDPLPLIILGFVGYFVFVLLFVRFIGMLRHKDSAMIQH
jgi:hypothetical protein